MEIRFNPLNPEEVAEVKSLLFGAPAVISEEKTYLPEDKPEPTPAAEEKVAADTKPEKETLVTETPEVAEAGAVTLDTLRNALSSINDKDKRNLVHVKSALSEFNAKKVSELNEADFAGFYDKIKEYA